MSALSKNERVFHHFLDFPVELRMMCIDEMKPDDRCRFTRCSKLSNKEAKRSKNYIYGLRFEAFFSFLSEIEVAYSNKGDMTNVLHFMEENRKKYMSYVDWEFNEHWREELNSSTNLLLYAAERFKNLLELYQSKIKFLSIVGSMFERRLKTYDFGIENLRNLEELRMNGNTESVKILAKLRRPLKSLIVLIVENNRIMTDCEQVYQVEKTLWMPDTKFTKEQLLQISASDVHIHIGDLTEMDIFHIIRSWQNETIQKEVAKYKWKIAGDSKFDMSKLLRLLGEGSDDLDMTDFEIDIKHFKKPRNRATLKYMKSDEENIEDDDDEADQLIFDVEYDKNHIIETMLSHRSRQDF